LLWTVLCNSVGWLHVSLLLVRVTCSHHQVYHLRIINSLPTCPRRVSVRLPLECSPFISQDCSLACRVQNACVLPSQAGFPCCAGLVSKHVVQRHYWACNEGLTGKANAKPNWTAIAR
jgi:hypothetical protein